MPRTAAAVNTLGTSGTAPAAEVASDIVNGNVVNGLHKNMWIEVTNVHASLARTITFVTPGTVGGFAVSDQVVSVPATAKRRFGGFDTRVYGSNLEFDGQTVDITYAVYQIA